MGMWDASLHPPPPTNDDADAPSWVLLDFRAYIGDRQNATTAFSKTGDGEHRIQVTFCVAQPPRVSYFCVYSPDLPHTEFISEPRLLATEGNLALLRVALAGPGVLNVQNYYIYKASQKGPPSLHLLPPPSRTKNFVRFFTDNQVGLLCRGASHRTDDRGKFTLRPHRTNRDDDLYTIAALTVTAVPGQFDLWLLRSEDNAWTYRTVALDQQQQQMHGDDDYFCHFTSNVITIGEEDGTIAFVDLWRGILQCDVLPDDPVLRYIPLPPPLEPGRKLSDTPSCFRDIAVVQGRIKYVELHVCFSQDPAVKGNYITAGWTAATWSRMATSLEEDWQLDCKIEACDITAENNPVHFELLPKLQNDEGTAQPTLERLCICQPTLSLLDDNIIYFMTKVGYRDDKAWVIAVDMRNRALQGVAEFGAQRTLGTSFAYVHSRISEYLNMAPGTKGHLKRSGMPLLGSSRKKMPEMIPFTDFLAITTQHSDSEHKHQDAEVVGSSLGAEDGDNMDLE